MPRTTRRNWRLIATGLIASVSLALAVGTATASEPDTGSGPALAVSESALDSALRCHDAPNPDDQREPALLVHGTTQTGAEAWDWNYVPALNAEGVDVCTVDLPDRALTDIQTSAEYTVHAIRVMSERYDSKVDVMGFSQGPLEPRWAIKFWPDVRDSVDDMVGLEPPNQGAAIGNILCASGACVPAAWQFSIGSNFITILNADDETPGDVDYSNVYSATDDVVFPQLPESQSVSRQGDGASNAQIQRTCPGRVVDHVQATADAVAYALVTDAFFNPGQADPERIDRSICGSLFLPGVTPASFALNTAAIYANGGPKLGGVQYPTVAEEPALRCYARPEGC